MNPILAHVLIALLTGWWTWGWGNVIYAWYRARKDSPRNEQTPLVEFVQR